MKIILALIIAVSLSTTVAACNAEKYPTKLPFANSPWIYEHAFIDVVTLAAVKHWTGSDYKTAIGDRFWDPSQSARAYAPCAYSNLPAAFLQDTSRCRLARQFSDLKACRNADGCGVLKFDPKLLSDPILRALIFESISNPCRVLQDAENSSRSGGERSSDRSREARYRGHGLAFSASEKWQMFRCAGRAPVHGSNITTENESGIVRFNF